MEFLVEEGRIYHQNERMDVLAEVTYSPVRAGVVDVDHFGMSDAAEREQAGRKEVTHGGFRVSENADYRYLAPVVLSPFRLRGSLGVG